MKNIPDEDMNKIMSGLFCHYTEMIEEANIPDLNERFNILSLCDIGRNLAFEKKLPVDKGNRWIGYIQGILIAHGITTIDAERDFTRKEFEEYYHKHNISYQSVDAKKHNIVKA